MNNQPTTTEDPLLEDWRSSFGVPPFGRISPEHFMPAFDRAFAEHDAENAAIAGDESRPRFPNTGVAMERCGRTLDRVGRALSVLSGSHTNDALLAVEREISPREARHWNGILLNEPLFRRIDALWQSRDTLGLNPEQARVLERYYVMFKHAGAALDAEARKRLAEVNERLA